MADTPLTRLRPGVLRGRQRRLSPLCREVAAIESVSVTRCDPHTRGLVMPQKRISLPRLKFLEKE